MIVYSFTYTCDKCHNVFGGSSTVPTNPDHQMWYKGFLCLKCYRQQTLDRFEYDND